MTKSVSQVQLENMRLMSVQRVIESISVFVLALFVSAILPSLLYRYVYASASLTESPVVLEYIPLVAFVGAVGYFVFAMVDNLMREKKMRSIMQEMVMMGDDCDCDCDCGHGQMEMAPVKAKKVAKK